MAQAALMSGSAVSSFVARGVTAASLSSSKAVSQVALPVARTSSRRAGPAAPIQAIFGKGTAAKTPKLPKASSVKEKVESGLFGSSSGFGFTKENEVLVGRAAMLGFAASLVGELLTGDGILAQLNIETGIPLNEIDPLVGFFIGFNVLGAIGALGDRGRFVDEPKTGLDRAVVPPGKGWRGALGLAEEGPLFGFTKANELFVGRLAQLGFAASILGEVITGKGALAQIGVETGLPLSEVDPLVGFFIVFLALAGISPASGTFVNDEE